MSITIEEIESLLDDVGFSYNRNNSDTIVTIFNSYNYLNLNTEKIFTIVVQVLEDSHHQVLSSDGLPTRRRRRPAETCRP